MKKNMKENFENLERRVYDTLDNSDLDYINSELRKISEPTIFSGVGGSSVVSEFGAKVLSEKNNLIAVNSEPRDFIYNKFNGFRNVIACSYSGNNYGTQLSFDNDLKRYLVSNNSFDDDSVTYLKYDTTIDREKSFISLASTLMPISILYNYYMNGDVSLLGDVIHPYDFEFDVNDVYEIFSGYDTSVTSKFLESTMVESGIGIPIVHDKYAYCHGRSNTSINFNSTAIYLNRGTEFDKFLLGELGKYYKNVVVINGRFSDDICDDYQMLVQAMYLTKYIAEKKDKDLSGVDYNPIVKKLYRYSGQI